MRIAITQRVYEHPGYPETRDALAQDWVRWAEQTFPGGALVPVPNTTSDPMDWAHAVDPHLLVLSGGNDLGESVARDRLEQALVGWFRAESRPIFAVCRGLQLVNEAFGGLLTRGLEAEIGVTHVGIDHEIVLSEPFSSMAGSDTVKVNSFHDHGVRLASIGSPLVAFGVDRHDVVEGLVHRDEPILAVQWHPERTGLVTPFDLGLARTLVSSGVFW